MLRTLFAGAAACAIVPAIALVRYLGAADESSALPAFKFALLLVLPCFGAVALLGLPLARVQSVPLKTWAFLGLGVLAALASWGTALLAYEQLRPNAGRLLSHLLLDGILCFSVFWYLAVGRSLKLKITTNGTTKFK
jgi:hypothetical protein